MSYTLVPYMIDLERLENALGSKDEALLAAVQAARPELFLEAEEDDEDDTKLSTPEALRQLVMGGQLDPESAYQYGYALELLCAHLGERLDADCWESITWRVLEASGMEEVFKSGPPVPLPPSEDFPRIGYLKADQVAALVAKLGDGHLKTAAPSGRKPRRTLGAWIMGLIMKRIVGRGLLSQEDIQESLLEYEGWLRQAAAAGRALMFFYY